MRFGLVASNIGSFSKPGERRRGSRRPPRQAGWEALLLWDHLAWVWDGPAVDPWVTLGAVAVRTERLLLGTCVTPVPRRRPQVLALQVATLDELSGGRAVLGAGLGGNRKEFEEFGESFDTERRWAAARGGTVPHPRALGRPARPARDPDLDRRQQPACAPPRRATTAGSPTRRPRRDAHEPRDVRRTLEEMSDGARRDVTTLRDAGRRSDSEPRVMGYSSSRRRGVRSADAAHRLR